MRQGWKESKYKVVTEFTARKRRQLVRRVPNSSKESKSQSEWILMVEATSPKSTASTCLHTPLQVWQEHILHGLARGKIMMVAATFSIMRCLELKNFGQVHKLDLIEYLFHAIVMKIRNKTLNSGANSVIRIYLYIPLAFFPPYHRNFPQ